VARREGTRHSLLRFACALRKKEYHAGITLETDPFRENVSKSNPMQEICPITKLEAVRDNTLLEIPVTYAHTISNYYNNLFHKLKNRIMMHLPRQNDCHTHNRYILHDAHNNLLVIDF